MDKAICILINSKWEGTAFRVRITFLLADFEWIDWVVSDHFALVMLRNMAGSFFLTVHSSFLDEACGNCFTVVRRLGILLECGAEESLVLHVESSTLRVLITSLLAFIKWFDIFMFSLKSTIMPIVWCSSAETIMSSIVFDVALVAWITFECNLFRCIFIFVNEAVFVLVNSKWEGSTVWIFITVWLADLEWSDWIVSDHIALVMIWKVTGSFFLTVRSSFFDEASGNCFTVVRRLWIILECGAEESLTLHVESNACWVGITPFLAIC